MKGICGANCENCEIYNTVKAGIAVIKNSNPHVVSCKIHDIPDSFGLAIMEEATGKYENCEIYKTGKSGIIVQDNANPHVIGCKIHDIPKQEGIFLRDKSSGIYENCKIYKTDKNRFKVITWLLDFLDNYKKGDKGLFLHGNFGCGKTYLLSAMLNELAKNGHKVAMIYYPEFLRILKSTSEIFFLEVLK